MVGVATSLSLEEVRAKRREYYWKNRDHIRAWRKSNRITNIDRELAHRKVYYENHKDDILIRNRVHKLAHPEQARRLAVAWKAKVKLEVLSHYGSGILACSQCGYSDIRALSIDHVNGGGRQHRASIKGYHIYAWLRKNSYPEGYQVLCMNCQFIKKVEGKEYGNYVQEKEEVTV